MAASAAVDRIGDLPDRILIGIISRLPTDEMARTSVLSPRWRRLWTSSPVLHFTRSFSRVSPHPKDLPAIVDLCLRQRPADSKLPSARFPLTNDADRWIRFSAAAGVEDLALTPASLDCGRFEIPPSLFHCRLLSSLKIGGAAAISAVPSPGFHFLRTLAFTNVTIKDDAMAALLSACPRIDHLSLSSVREIASLVIRAPAMRHLMVHDCHDLRSVELLDVPELRRLLYCGKIDIVSKLKGVGRKLHEAAMLSLGCSLFANTDPKFWEMMIAFVSKVRVLHMNGWLLEFMKYDYDFGSRVVHQIFENLEELLWWPVYTVCAEDRWWPDTLTKGLRRLVFFLIHCPSLEKLCILCNYYMEKDDGDDYDDIDDSDDDDDYDEDPLQAFKFVEFDFPRLKSINLKEFSGKKGEMRLLKFVAGKAVVLESMNLYYVCEVSHRLNKIQKKLHAIHRISPAARIFVSKFDESKVCPKHEKIWPEFMVI